MFKFLKGSLGTLFLMFYVMVRGPSKTISVEPGNIFRYVPGEDNDVYFFECKQRKHTTRYSQWFIPSMTVYSYLVEMAKVHDDQCIGGMVNSYPELCSPRFRHTSFPLRCAIAACIHELTSKEVTVV